MESISKRTTVRKVVEYIATCKYCKKKIIGSTNGQVVFNLMVHKQGKNCGDDK